MILPAGVAPEARLLLAGKALRAFVDGYVAVLLPAYLLALGFGTLEVGPRDANALEVNRELP